MMIAARTRRPKQTVPGDFEELAARGLRQVATRAGRFTSVAGEVPQPSTARDKGQAVMESAGERTREILESIP